MMRLHPNVIGLTLALWLTFPVVATSMTLEPATNRPGQDYRNFTLSQADPGLCRDACAGEERCEAFTYVKPGLQGPGARCWLKHAAPPSHADDCCVSGVKNPPPVAPAEGKVSFGELEPNTNRGGLDYHSFNLPEADPKLCLAECAKQARCKAFTYVRPGLQGPSARCWLKHSLPPASPHDCCVSGVKTTEPAALPTTGLADRAPPLGEMPAAGSVAAVPGPMEKQPSGDPRPPVAASQPAAPTPAPMTQATLSEPLPGGSTDATGAVREAEEERGLAMPKRKTPPPGEVAATEETPARTNETPDVDTALLSAGQHGVFEQYGWPQTFSLMFYTAEDGEDVVRQETWNYHAAGLAFTFIEGRLAGRHLPLADVPGASYPAYRPSQFVVGMRLEEVLNAFPAIQEFYQEKLPGEEMSTYWVDRLVMGFVGDVLVYVETRPQLPQAEQAPE